MVVLSWMRVQDAWGRCRAGAMPRRLGRQSFKGLPDLYMVFTTNGPHWTICTDETSPEATSATCHGTALGYHVAAETGGADERDLPTHRSLAELPRTARDISWLRLLERMCWVPC